MTLMSYKKNKNAYYMLPLHEKKNSNQFHKNDTQSSSNNKNVGLIYRSCLLCRGENVNYAIDALYYMHVSSHIREMYA